VKKVEDVVKVLQEEFVVSVSRFVASFSGINGVMHLHRTGLKRRKSTAIVFKILGTRRLLNGF
jgi:hypothetical protein